ncbi:MAG: alpha/beta hydrolase [Thermoguttaceae bacterium]|nr:alpha/beta hydrolase [Thermoguttaceae bacterium]
MYNRRIFRGTLLAVAAVIFTAGAFGVEPQTFNLWPDVPPDETASSAADLPVYRVFIPEKQTSDTCVIVCPGGAYNVLDSGVDSAIAEKFNALGMVSVVLRYRVPRREGRPKHLAPWQDAQRLIRIVRSRADEWNVNPDKIGMLGWSAGGHLTLMAATSSETESYTPTDEIDKFPANLDFAVPIYPAYVLEDGANGPNAAGGNDSPMVSDFAFDAKTPPICLLHGDADVYSPMGSVAVYAKLRKIGVPAELHVYAGAVHGFVLNHPEQCAGDWFERVVAWMRATGF